MKKIITIIVVLISTCFVPANLNAQKIGHLNVDSLMRIWPAYQKVVDSLADLQIQLQQQAQTLLAQIARQEHLIDSTKGKVSPLIAELQMAQLNQLKDNYMKFTELAQQDIQELQIRLSDTLYKQLNTAILKVAKENGYTYILDSSKGGQVMYASPTYDVFDLVRQELKIPVPVKRPTQETVVPVIGGK